LQTKQHTGLILSCVRSFFQVLKNIVLALIVLSLVSKAEEIEFTMNGYAPWESLGWIVNTFSGHFFQGIKLKHSADHTSFS
jgi:hypothetical protein